MINAFLLMPKSKYGFAFGKIPYSGYSGSEPSRGQDLVPTPVQAYAMKAALQRLHADLTASAPGTPITEADLTWALQAVRSRAFSGPYAGDHTYPYENWQA